MKIETYLTGERGAVLAWPLKDNSGSAATCTQVRHVGVLCRSRHLFMTICQKCIMGPTKILLNVENIPLVILDISGIS